MTRTLWTTIRTGALGLAMGAAAFAVAPAPDAVAAEPAVQSTETDSWTVTTGEIVNSQGDFFIVETDGEVIRVEMDKWIWYNMGSRVPKGSRVTVYGSPREARSHQAVVDADGIYVHDRRTFYFANASDRKVGYNLYARAAQYEHRDMINIVGVVAYSDARMVEVDTGSEMIRVDTTNVNERNRKRFEQLSVGDIIAVSGRMNRKFVETHKVEGEFVLPLSPRARQKIFLTLKQRAADSQG